MPDADRAQGGHDAEKQRHQYERALGRDEDDLTIGAVDDGAAESREEHARRSEAEPFESQIERRIRQLKNQPALRGGLYQCARVAEKQAAPKDKIVPIAKSAEGIGEHEAVFPKLRGPSLHH